MVRITCQHLASSLRTCQYLKALSLRTCQHLASSLCTCQHLKALSLYTCLEAGPIIWGLGISWQAGWLGGELTGVVMILKQ